MNAPRVFWMVRPKSRKAWLVFAAFAFLFAIYFGPRLLDPRVFLACLAIVPLVTLIAFLPSRFINSWDTIPQSVRGSLCAILAYVFLVTIGNMAEIYTFRLWFSFVTLTHHTPFTAVHLVSFLGGAAAYLTQGYKIEVEIPKDETRIIDGPILTSLEEARAKLSSTFVFLPNEPRIFWGGIERPISHGSYNFLIEGTANSGKSKSIQLLMNGVLPHVRPGTNRRALVYDVKRDIYGTILAMGVPAERIRLLNPFDIRCAGWDIAADVTDKETATEIGTLLVPEKSTVQPFFPDSARLIIGAAMDAFHGLAPGRWTLRDVVLTLQTAERLKIVLKASKNLYYLVEKFINDAETARSIAATIETVMRRLSFVAGCWDHAKERFSVTEWLKSEQILLLGSSPKLDSTIQQVNAALVYRITQAILDGPEKETMNPEPQTWLFIDEFRLAGKITDFGKFMIGSRTKGACVVLGFQDYPGLVEAYDNNPNTVKEILGGCGHKAFTRLEPESATVASEWFRTQQIEITRYSPSWSQTLNQSLRETTTSTSSSLSVSISPQVRAVVPPDKLQYLEWPNPKGGLKGYYIDPSLRNPYFGTIPGDVIAALPKANPAVVNYDERPPELRALKPWTIEDLKRLGLAEHAKELLVGPQIEATEKIPAKEQPKKDGKRSPFDFISRWNLTSDS